MNLLIICLSYLCFVQSFSPLFRRNIKTKLYSKKMDIYDKFEQYSLEGNKTMQDLYLFKIHEFLSIKYDLQYYEKALLEENKEDQEKYLAKIHNYIHLINNINKQ